MDRKEFKEKLQRHDWYFEYSDDLGVWTRGKQALAELKRNHAELECPFDFPTLQAWANRKILEHFAEEEPGRWWRQPRKYAYLAPVKREDLITQAIFDKIEDWMEG